MLRETCLRRPLHNNIMITKVGEEGAFTRTAPKLLPASHNNFLIAKHEGIMTHVSVTEPHIAHVTTKNNRLHTQRLSANLQSRTKEQ